MPPGFQYESEYVLRSRVVGVCKRMYAHGLIASTDGNVSVRLTERRLLVTPSGVHKGLLEPSDLVVVDGMGRPQRGGRASSELQMHLHIYEIRPDVRAIVHAHPPFAVACTLAKLALDVTYLPEVVFALGTIPTVPYSTPTTKDVSNAVDRVAQQHDAFMLERHGSVTLASDVETAYNRLEALEHTAKIVHAARQVGLIEPLPACEVKRLYQVAAAAGIRWRFLENS
ncbi:MAG: class II aldolase/adducin family protein [Myxococcales bacterium]|nr:class II aldolase/adducin family protein [Myxococcales bacterium]